MRIKLLKPVKIGTTERPAGSVIYCDEPAAAKLMASKDGVHAPDAVAEAADAFRALGLNVPATATAKDDEVLIRVGEALAKIEDPAKRTRVASAILGPRTDVLLAIGSLAQPEVTEKDLPVSEN